MEIASVERQRRRRTILSTSVYPLTQPVPFFFQPRTRRAVASSSYVARLLQLLSMATSFGFSERQLRAAQKERTNERVPSLRKTVFESFPLTVGFKVGDLNDCPEDWGRPFLDCCFSLVVKPTPCA